MNMPGVSLSSRWRVVWFLAVLLLVACSPGGEEPDPALFAEDSWWQTVERHLRPRQYWSEKVQQLHGQHQVTRAEFYKKFQEYQAMLRARRTLMAQRMAQLKAQGKDPGEGRKEAVNQYRQEIDRLRQENRDMAKQLQREDKLLTQAQRALQQSR